MVESKIHLRLKKEIGRRYKMHYNVCEEFEMFNRWADIVLFKNHRLFAIIECKNKQFEKELFQKFEYWRSKGIKCNFMVFSVPTKNLEKQRKRFEKRGIFYEELNLEGYSK